MISTHSTFSTDILRVLLLVIAVAAWYNLDYLNDAIAYIWNVVYPSSYFRHDSFEVIQSSVLFAVYTLTWVILDFYVPAAHVFRIPDHSTSNQSWKGRESAFFQETLWYSLPWITLDLFVPRRHWLLSHFSEPPTLLRIVQDICLTFILYDLLFFIGHSMMHRNRFLFRTVHYKHHAMGANIRAGDAIRHTFLDGFFDVICSVIALKVVRAHPLSRSIFNTLAIFLISEAHSGYDFPWSTHNILTFFAGPILHRKHHHNGSCNFAKFFVWCDYLCGTLSYAK